MAEEVKILEIEFQNAIKQIQELTKEAEKLKAQQVELGETVGKTSDEYIEVSAQLKVTNAEIRANQKVVENSIKANKQNGDSIAALRSQLSNAKRAYSELSAEERNNEQVGGQLLKRTADLNAELKRLEATYGDNQRSVGDYRGAIADSVNSIDALRQRAKELREEAARLDLNSQEFRDATDAAANLELQVDQALGKVNEFGQREPRNPAKKAFDDAVTSAVTLGATVKLLSDSFVEGEDAQQALAKAVQGFALAQTIANLVKQKGAIIDTATLITTKAQTIASLAAAKVTGILTGATRLFGITATQAWAAATLGLSVLITGLVALIANFKEITNAVKEFFGITKDNSEAIAESFRKGREEIDGQVKALQAVASQTERNFSRQIKLAEAAGRDTSKLRQAQFNETKKFLEAEIKLIEQRIALEAQGLNEQKAREFFQTRLQLQEKLKDVVVDFEARSIETERKIREEAAKTGLERLKAKRQEINELIKEETRANRLIRDLQIELLEDQIEKERELIREKFKRLIEDEKNAAVVILLKQKEQKELSDLEKRITNDRLNEQAKRATEENASLNLRLAANEAYRARLLEINQGISEDAQAQLLATDESTIQRLLQLQEFFGVSQQTLFDQFQVALEENEDLTFENFVAQQEKILAFENQVNQQRLQLATNFGAALGDILAESISDTENGLESFGRGFTLLILDVLQKQIQAAIAAAAATEISQKGVPAGIITAGLATAAIQAAFGIAKSQLSKPPKGFATGVVGLNGAGTETSDSIPAWLSRGESVVTASGTKWMQNTFPGLLEFANSKHKFATGVVNFNPSPQVGDQFSILDALRTLPPPVVRVTDIDKGFQNAQEVQVLGSL